VSGRNDAARQVGAKRLLIVVNTGWFFVSHRLPVAIAAQREGYEVHVAVALDPELDKDTPRRLAERGITLHRLSLSRSGSRPLDLLATFRELSRLFGELRPDIVHLVTLKPVLLGGIAARLRGIANVVLAIPGRGTVFSAAGIVATLRRWCALLLYRLAYRRKRNRVIFQNVEDRDYFLSRSIFDSQDVRLIRGSGVDIGAYSLRPERDTDEKRVVLASRMLIEKGIADFVAAAKALREQGVKARFVLVGAPDPGNPHSHTAEQLTSWHESGVVEWLGYRTDMPAIFGDCHIVCLPTYYGEGLPKVLIEAAACGRPIVTTDTPGCRDIVRDGVNGVLVAPRDVAALSAALRRLIDDKQLRAEMGRRGRALVEAEFTVETVVQATLSVYREFH
jgi:glycosyltransferase involved in cell wall biosynthesis